MTFQILSARGAELGDRPVSPAGNQSSPSPGRVPSKHIITYEDITICKTLGTGEFGTVQQGIWTNDEGDRVCHFLIRYYLSNTKNDGTRVEISTESEREDEFLVQHLK